MLNLENITQIESLFDDMEPENLAGQSFTPSVHQEEITVDVSYQEYESDEEIEGFDDNRLGPYTVFNVSDIPVPAAAVDVGVIDLGLTRTGFALAFKGAVVMQELEGTHSVLKIGPRVKFITPENRAEVLRYVGQALLNEEMFVEIHSDGSLTIKAGAREPNQYKDRIRNFIERMLQLDVIRDISNGITLIDGTLTLRTYNTPQVFLEQLGREAQRRNSDIVGVSKKSRITVDGVHINALLDNDPADAGFRRVFSTDTEGSDSAAGRRNLGELFAVRFAPGGFTFRVDVARRSSLANSESVLHTLYSNTQMTLGYPNLLRLAHIHSAFTKGEIVGLQVKAAHDYGVQMRPPEDHSIIFAPFRKGIGG